MKGIEEAIKYFKDAIKESEEIMAECSEKLQKQLTEQKGHFEVALAAMKKQIPVKAKLLKKIPGICKCPICKIDLCTENGKQIYCPDCGQALIV